MDNNSFFDKHSRSEVDSFLNTANQIIKNFDKEYATQYLAKLEKYQLEQSEHGRNHNAVLIERRMIERVKAGDLEGIKKMYQSEADVDLSTIGNVSKDFLKSYEYYMVTEIILVSRAAAEAGVSVEAAYELSDIFLQELSTAKTFKEYMKISMLSNLMFTKLVSDTTNNKKYPFIDACKDYIARNLRKPFKIQDISQQIGVNNSYLSKIFSKTEGMTISQYIAKERCSHAANLLKYSDYDISEIAEYFCFSSQSHFGVQFKKIYGMTPKEYRIRYKESGVYSYQQ